MSIQNQVENGGLGRYYCRKCADRSIYTGAQARYSMGIYAGMYCEKCWEESGYDPDARFDPMDAGEHYSEEDY